MRRLAFLLLLFALATGSRAAEGVARAAPAFTSHDPQQWLNSPPLTLAGLAGRVVLIEFWSADCGNCWLSTPWLLELERRHGAQGFSLVGVHVPRSEEEADLSRIRLRMQHLGMSYPVMLDHDRAYWQAIGNRFWPTFYVVDKRGLIRAVLIGRTRSGEANAMAIEDLLLDLLAEDG